MIKKLSYVVFFGFIVLDTTANTKVLFKEKYGVIHIYNKVNKVEEKTGKYYVYESDTLKAVLNNSEYSIINIERN